MCKSYCWSGSRCSIGQPLLLTQTSWVLPPLSVGKMTLRLYGALNYSHGLSKGPSFGTGRGRNTTKRLLAEYGIAPAPERGRSMSWSTFIKAHWGAIAATDLFTVEVL